MSRAAASPRRAYERLLGQIEHASIDELLAIQARIQQQRFGPFTRRALERAIANRREQLAGAGSGERRDT